MVGFGVSGFALTLSGSGGFDVCVSEAHRTPEDDKGSRRSRQPPGGFQQFHDRIISPAQCL